MWDLASQQVLGALDGHGSFGFAPDVAFTPDGSRMASVVGGGGLILWDLTVESWTNEACSVVGRDLTELEWRTYIGSVFTRSERCVP